MRAGADLSITGSLSIAAAILLASGQVDGDFSDVLLLGELALDGTLRHTQGILPMLALARAQGLRRVYVPAVDAAEASLIEGIEVYGLATLADLGQARRVDDTRYAA